MMDATKQVQTVVQLLEVTIGKATKGGSFYSIYSTLLYEIFDAMLRTN